MSPHTPESYDAIDFQDQHAKIIQCVSYGIPEAAILLLARCTEYIIVTMTVRALGYHGSGARLADCAELLRQADLMPVSTMCWTNAIRRFGNSIRHSPIAPTIEATDLAVVLYSRIVRWVSEKDAAANIPPIDSKMLANSGQMLKFVRLVERYEQSGRLGAGSRFGQDDDSLVMNPEVTAAMCEILLNRGKPNQSLTLAESNLKRNPRSIRLQQLSALAYSRTGQESKGMAIISRLIQKGNRDDETLGIGAGIYKRLGAKEKSRAKLQLSHDYYSEVWRRSNPKLLYHGVNAAATALYLGNAKLCRSYAASVHYAAIHRLAGIKSTPLRANGLNLWDRLSHAEALLLLGRIGEESACYSDVFQAGKMASGMIKTARMQLKSNVQHMHLDLKKIMDQRVGPADDRNRKRVFVLGHRNWKLSENARTAFLVALKKQAGGKGQLSIISNMAAGSDQILPRIAIDEGLCGHFLACLPKEIDQMYGEMPTSNDRRRFSSLLSEANEIRIELASEKETRAGDFYSRAVKWALANCDAVIAVWDGQPARGAGGTGETVNAAREAGKPVYWISSTTEDLKLLP